MVTLRKECSPTEEKMALNIFRAKTCFLVIILWIYVANTQAVKEIWSEYGDYSYLFINPPLNTHLTWHEAEIKCRGKDSLLVSFRNASEQEFVLSKIKEESRDGLYWIGLSSLNVHDEYQWLDNTSLLFENWAEGSNYKDRLKREKCAQLDSKSGKWQDNNCGEWAGAICKRSSKTKVLPPLPKMPENGNCPQGWHKYDVKCYQINDEPKNWTTAKEDCRSIDKNHDLVSIHRTAENMFLTSMLSNDTWIGGVSLKNELGFGWSDNSPFDYDKLQRKTTTWKNKCVQILADEHKAGTWEAISCSEERMYVCQRYIDTLIPVSPPTTPSKCKNENYKLVEYRDNCYLTLKNELKSWIEAEKLCETFGAHLASIGNAFESAFIYSYLFPLSNDVWIGLQGELGLYRWLDTWPLYYTNWMEGHPRNDPNNQTKCVVLSKETQKWKEDDCDASHAFLCKLSDEEPPEIETFDGVCPDYLKNGLDLGGRYCYSVYGSENKASWDSAHRTCLKYKSKLASFHSEHEIRILGPHLKNMEEAWIGLHQIHDGTYEWADESPLDFVNWENGVVPDAECVLIGIPRLTWLGGDCGKQKPFVCAAPKIVRSTNENKEGKGGSGGLSSGGIAGIVITVLIIVPGLLFMAYYLWKNDKLRFLRA